MSITSNGVKLNGKRGRGFILTLIFGFAEGALTILLAVSLSAVFLFPDQAQAAVGVSDMLSYQGRLTDASGSPLGGTGTDYCFQFSIYDNSLAGSKLWPSGSPTTDTIEVINGVFNAGIGTADDLSTFNFYDSDTIYLNIGVAAQVASSCDGVSFENLSPRQRIDAVAYAKVARDVYGDLLKTKNSNSTVQIGAGTGTASPIYLALDVKTGGADTIGGACTQNGALWYNSTNTRALVCENSTIQEIGNGATIVGIRSDSNATVLSSGTVMFSAVTNLTINQEGQTLKFSGPAGGGVPNYTRWHWPIVGWAALTSVTALTAVSSRPFFWPVHLDGNLSLSNVGFQASMSKLNAVFTLNFGVYTYNGATLNLLGSAQDAYTFGTANSGQRIIWMTSPRGVAAISSLSPGNYVFGFLVEVGSALGGTIWGVAPASPLGEAWPGNSSTDANTSNWAVAGFGRYTVNSANLPDSFTQGQIIGKGSGASAQIVPIIYIVAT